MRIFPLSGHDFTWLSINWMKSKKRFNGHPNTYPIYGELRDQWFYECVDFL